MNSLDKLNIALKREIKRQKIFNITVFSISGLAIITCIIVFITEVGK